MSWILVAEWVLSGAAVVIAVVAVLHVLQSRKPPSNTILWILVVTYLPWIGPLLYLVLGINDVRRRIEKRQSRQQRLTFGSGLLEAPPGTVVGEGSHATFGGACPPVLREFFQLLDNLVRDPAVGGNRCTLMRGGEEVFAAMERAIAEARHHVHLQTFILDDDEVGGRLLDAAATRARRDGVEVRVLVDGYGSNMLSPRRVRHYRGLGIDLRVLRQLQPLRGRFAINLRNHRKILVVDGQRAFTGGMNLSARHLLRAERPHLDYHTEVRGPVVPQLQRVFAEDWFDVTGESIMAPKYFPAVAAAGDDVVRTISSGPDNHREVLLKVWCAAVQTAARSIHVVTPYFVPDPAVLMLLKLAALGGVETHLVLPRDNNIRTIKFASRYHYRELLEAGVRIHERRPPFSHAKLFVVDDLWASVGSANWDNRTFHLQFDTNIGVISPSFVAQVRAAVDAEMAASTEITLEACLRRPRWRGVLERAASMFEDVL